jgi:protein-S-isoprenylcysteine O-methyltransferase Ste14
MARSALGPVLGSLLFLVVAPGTLAGWVPWWITAWHLEAPLLGWSGGRWIGGLLIAVGLAALLDCFARFALEGRGTPAPVAAPERLVLTGLYRHVRNPMYVCILSLVAGQGLLFGSVALLRYAMVLALGFSAFVLLYEEPTLRDRFGREYLAYCAAVPRFWPRLRPWRPEVPADRDAVISRTNRP